MSQNFQPKKQSACFGPQSFDIVGFTIGTKSVNTINVALQLRDARGNAIGQAAHVRVYLSDLATGLAITATALTTPPVVGTNGAVLVIAVTGKIVDCVTDTSGRLDLNLIQSASPVTAYLVVEMPDGSVSVSSAIVW